MCATLAFAAREASAATAEVFPNKPIRVVVGPGTDFLPRLLGPKLYAVWGQQLVIDQRPGGGGAIAADIVAKAAPDGHTWLVGTAVFTINASMYAKPPYNLERDFAPVTGLATATFLMLVYPAVPAKTVAEFIQLARDKPGQINYASSGVGTPPHLAGEMMKSLARVNMLHVPYKSAAASLNELLAGQVQMTFQFMPAALPHVRTGRLRALGVSSAKRSPLAPELPTIIEAGLPGFEVIGWNGVHMPQGHFEGDHRSRECGAFEGARASRHSGADGGSRTRARGQLARSVRRVRDEGSRAVGEGSEGGGDTGGVRQ